MKSKWYAVTLLMKCRIGDVCEPPVTCFEQIHLLKAKDSDTAHEKALRLGKSEEHSYINQDGDEVHWEFVGLINLEEILDDPIRDGTEIRSRLLSVVQPEKLVRDKPGLTVFISREIGDKTAQDILNDGI